jgi:hypothetical protein
MSLRSTPAAASTSKPSRVAAVGRLANRSRPASRRASVASTLDGQQPLQRHGQRQLLGGGLVDHGGQGFGGGMQFQRGQMAA